nr:hypothetical protein [Streptomyces longispororuber]
MHVVPPVGVEQGLASYAFQGEAGLLGDAAPCGIHRRVAEFEAVETGFPQTMARSRNSRVTAAASEGRQGRRRRSSSSMGSVGWGEALRLPVGITAVTREGMVDIMASPVLGPRVISRT